MGQVSSKLRRGVDCYLHWCPGCMEMHPLPDLWKSDGDLESPTFIPSFKHEGMQRVYVNGKWTGEWKRNTSGSTIPSICHYTLIGGILHFCNDCTHELVNQSIPLPTLPQGLTDDD